MKISYLTYVHKSLLPLMNDIKEAYKKSLHKGEKPIAIAEQQVEPSI